MSAVTAFAVLAVVLLAGLAVFSLLLVTFDDNGAGDLDAPRALLLGVLTTLGLALGITLVTLVAGLGVDRLTRHAPLAVRLVVPVPLPVIGVAVLVWGPGSVGFPVLVLGVAFLVYWVVLLLQAGVVHLLHRVRQG